MSIARKIMRDIIRNGVRFRKRGPPRGEIAAVGVSPNPGGGNIEAAADKNTNHGAHDTVEAVGTGTPFVKGADADPRVKSTDEARTRGSLMRGDPPEFALEGPHLLEVDVMGPQ